MLAPAVLSTPVVGDALLRAHRESFDLGRTCRSASSPAGEHGKKKGVERRHEARKY